jgi:hypothetical protein
MTQMMLDGARDLEERMAKYLAIGAPKLMRSWLVQACCRKERI